MAYVGSDFDSTSPDEVEDYTFNFAKDIDPDDSIASVTWTISVATDSVNPDTDAASRLLSAPTNDNKTTTAVVGTCLNGVKYLVLARVITANGETVELYSYLPCEAPG